MNGTLIYLDTHVVARLAQSGTSILSSAAAEALEEAGDIRISPMVRLELQYLYEIGRVDQGPVDVLDSLYAAIGLRLCDAPFPAVAREAEQHGWTRDPFDRLIVAQASLHAAPLITQDSNIQRHYPAAFW